MSLAFGVTMDSLDSLHSIGAQWTCVIHFTTSKMKDGVYHGMYDGDLNEYINKDLLIHFGALAITSKTPVL